MSDSFEKQVQDYTRQFHYPPTPDLAAGLLDRQIRPRGRARYQRRAAAWVLAAVMLVVACSLLFTPGVRAQLIEFLQIGAIRIFFNNPTPTLPAQQVTAVPTENQLPLLVEILPGGTTLAQARQLAGFPIKLPAVPKDLGNPDEVYILETGSPVVLLVWNPIDNPPRPRTSLFIFGPNDFAGKKITYAAQSVEVNGSEALWITEPHTFEFYENQRRSVLSYFVPDRVLIWWDADGLTYRLEGSFTLEEALEIAASIK